jgi:hypothetical protein
MHNLTTLLIKLPRNTEITPEASKTFLSALTQINGVTFFQKLTGVKAQPLALEICLINQQIQFLITCDVDLVPFVTTQIQSNYPLAIIEKRNDPMEGANIVVNTVILKKGSYYPIADYSKFADIDPLSSVLSVLSKSDPDELAIIQIALEGAGSAWQSNGASYADKGDKKEDGSYTPRHDQAVIKEKISYPGFKVSIRIAGNSEKTRKELISSFGVYTRSDGNSFSKKKKSFLLKDKSLEQLLNREVTDNQVMNILELATVWHLPSDKIKTPTIAWGQSVLSEPPETLPTALEVTDEEKKGINFFAKTLYKNKETIFGIKDVDRRRHLWTIGKTGTGKSTLLINMAIDACEILLNYVPKNRINDVIYFNPADKDFPVTINPLEVTNKEEAELVVSGIVSIFNKIFGFSWGPRLEYILRTTLLTLTDVPNTTLKDVPMILTNQAFRKSIVENVKDPMLKSFWVDEFEKMTPQLQKESISPILNKVGQFVTSPLIRSVIGSPKSSVKLDDAMNDGKIVLCNLSQGRLGEDNAALLGAMLITKLQLAAMHRVDMDEDLRKDFYLYVDEFQNFATSSFIKIMSEARKYRLNITLANQYMAQIPEEVQKAILGNAGTIITFAVGASDADILYKEFAEVFTQNDMVNLSNYQVAIKMTINGLTTRPFLARTLPLPLSSNQHRDKVISASRQRWARRLAQSFQRNEERPQSEYPQSDNRQRQ